MQTEIISVQDIWLASALLSYGVPFFKADPIRRIREKGKEVCHFNFEVTDTGKEICKNWLDKSFCDKNPEHHLAYIHATMHNRERLLDLVKQSPTVEIVQSGGRVFFVPIEPKEASRA